MMSKTNQLKGQSELQLMIDEMTRTKKQGINRTPRFRFRALVRTVINNLKWLQEKESGEDTKTKFTKKMKGLLRSDEDRRTSEDRTLIRRLIGNLKCLHRYPVHVRENLATAAMFSYFGPGRKLVSEGHPSVAMYFIISGEANVSKMTFDPGVREERSINVGVMEAGESFGEINILHDEPWPNTVTSSTGIQVLSVQKEDFQRILQVFLGDQKKLITEALKTFSFFKNWNDRAVLECCILARIENYHKDDLIFGDGTLNSRNSYFIISGQCLVVYHLQIEIIDRCLGGFPGDCFKLQQDLRLLHLLPLPLCRDKNKVKILSKVFPKISSHASSVKTYLPPTVSPKLSSHPSSVKFILHPGLSPKISSYAPSVKSLLRPGMMSEKSSSHTSQSSKKLSVKPSSRTYLSSGGISRKPNSSANPSSHTSQSSRNPKFSAKSSSHTSQSSNNPKLSPSSHASLSSKNPRFSPKSNHVTSPSVRTLKMTPSAVSRLTDVLGEEAAESLMNSLSSEQSTETDDERLETVEVESHFIRIGILFPGQCFGIGENLTNKFFLSDSEPLTVLSIPRDFLKLHNHANIWARLMEFFNRTYPDHEMIFQEFLSLRKWEIERWRYVSSLVKKDKFFTGLTTAEVPYHFRLTEDVANPIFNMVRKTVRKVKIVTEE